MVISLPTSFGTCEPGERLNLVGRLQFWDSTHDAHRMTAVHDGTCFLLSGLIEGGGETFSLLNAEFRRQFPIPFVALDSKSHVLAHDKPSWDGLHSVVELCAGFGGLSQGLAAAGFHTSVAVDCNEKFLQLYAKQGNADCLLGDVNDVETVPKLWQLSKGSNTIAAGYACQPFSALGDQRGGCDPRALCLRGILTIAFFLQTQAIILECVHFVSGPIDANWLVIVPKNI